MSNLSGWKHPTLAAAGLRHAVKCRCGRPKPADEMYDVRALGLGVPYLCSPCIEDLYRKGVVDRLTFHRQAGAPSQWIAAYEAKLLRGPFLRSGLPQHVWGEILARGLDAAAAKVAARAAAEAAGALGQIGGPAVDGGTPAP